MNRVGSPHRAFSPCAGLSVCCSDDQQPLRSHLQVDKLQADANRTLLPGNPQWIGTSPPSKG